MAENAASEWILTTVGSEQLGLRAGNIDDLDQAVTKLPRKQLALRVVTVLAGLEADRASACRNVSAGLAREIAQAFLQCVVAALSAFLRSEALERREHSV